MYTYSKDSTNAFTIMAEYVRNFNQYCNNKY